MAGFFGLFNFEKPGRGIDKDAPSKRGFFLFFEIYLRKFWRIATLSLSYTLLSIPAFLVYYMWAVFLQGLLTPLDSPEAAAWFSIYIALFFLCFLGAGPASAGQAYVLRNFSRESHAWVWDDLWANTKENLGKGLLVFIMDLVVFTVLLSAAVLYFTKSGAMPFPPVVTMAFGFLALFALLIYVMMHFFLYPLMVTMDLKFGKLVKTALQLTLLKLPGSIVVFCLSLAAFALFLYIFLINFGLIVVFMAIGFSTVAFVYTFYSTSVIDKILDERHTA